MCIILQVLEFDNANCDSCRPSPMDQTISDNDLFVQVTFRCSNYLASQVEKGGTSVEAEGSPALWLVV